jgi:hypothetical protein
MKDEKRAADDAERDTFEEWASMNVGGLHQDHGEYIDADTRKAWDAWQAALSARADGGKGEAVRFKSPLDGRWITAPQAECAPQQTDAEALYEAWQNTLKHVETQPGSPNFDGAEAYEAHLNAECAPREAQPDLRMLGYELEGVLIDVANDGFDKVCLETVRRVRTILGEAAAPTPERADAEKDAALTDEQIIEIFQDHYTEEPGDAEPGHILPFARAILAADKGKK